MLQIVKRILGISSYNGLGCIDFKMQSSEGGPFDLNSHINIQATSDADSVMTEFLGITPNHVFTAVPKILELNPRVCRFVVRHHEVLREMMRLYSANI